jgi:hypothetical protein
MPRPGGDTLLLLAQTLEDLIDRAAAARPNPGARRFQRLNRADYERSILSLLDLKVDAESWLPLDMTSAGYDNVSDAQALSPTLLEAYLNAATDVTRMAMGDPTVPATSTSYNTAPTDSQHEWDHVDGTPYGTRGGLVVEHVFPADARYVFELSAGRGGTTRFEQIDVSIDGESVAVLDIEAGVRVFTDPIAVTAGQHRVSAAFIRKMEGPYPDDFKPNDSSRNPAGASFGGEGITSPLHLGSVTIKGPFEATGVSDTPSRLKIFSCRPRTAAEERPCAQQILSRIAADAYRSPPSAEDLAGLMEFYDAGAAQGGFELGVRGGLQAILASPYFVFRLEQRPGDVAPGQNYRIADSDLATRLSFFLWGTLPDDELLALASQGKLSDERVLEQQIRRLVADPRSDALGTRFASQWLRLEDMKKVEPDRFWYPEFDQHLADDMRHETELFFNTLVREDRSLLEFYNADYTFLNDRLAQHYGIPNVIGSHFRRVQYPDETRRGILGHGSMLLLTSMATRTSPVLRGKWVLEVLNGTPPPPPPPDVPDLDATATVQDGKNLTTRERMQIHRKSPTCNACHRSLDPLGLALDNFDVTGRWRIRESGMPLDTRGDFWDGTQVSSPSQLSAALLKRPTPLVRNFTANLLTFALGRRVEYYDQPTVRAIAKEAEANGFKMSSFIVGVVKSDAFRMKRAGETTSNQQ